MAVYCKNCGTKFEDGVRFCPNCGFALSVLQPTAGSMPPESTDKREQGIQNTPHHEKNSTNITLCDDGKYRWTYEMNLFRNPTIFIMIWKIFFFIVLGLFAFLVLIGSGDSGFWWSGFLDTAQMFGFILIGITVLITLGYLVYAAIMGGKYIVEFEMDEKGVNHRQTDLQAKKSKKLGQATLIAGAATGRFSTAGIGLNAQRTEMYTEFSKVRNVRAYPRRSLIKLNELLEHNQVYAAKEDFAFVKDYIVSHCPNIKQQRL